MWKDQDHPGATCPIHKRLLDRAEGKSLASTLAEANIDEIQVGLLLIVYHFIIIKIKRYLS